MYPRSCWGDHFFTFSSKLFMIYKILINIMWNFGNNKMVYSTYSVAS